MEAVREFCFPFLTLATPSKVNTPMNKYSDHSAGLLTASRMQLARIKQSTTSSKYFPRRKNLIIIFLNFDSKGKRQRDLPVVTSYNCFCPILYVLYVICEWECDAELGGYDWGGVGVGSGRKKKGWGWKSERRSNIMSNERNRVRGEGQWWEEG